MNKVEEVILVDEKDQVIGYMEKIQAHKEALLHRAFSIFIFNSKKELLLQQRAEHKYHSGNLWTNTCCSHPRKGETIPQAADRRLEEEMGMRCSLEKVYSFIYKSPYENGLTEHELDHVLIGYSDELPKINLEEVKDYVYKDLETLAKEIEETPNLYTSWFKITFPTLQKYLLES